jgi:hypothetical protein
MTLCGLKNRFNTFRIRVIHIFHNLIHLHLFKANSDPAKQFSHFSVTKQVLGRDNRVTTRQPIERSGNDRLRLSAELARLKLKAIILNLQQTAFHT